MELDPQEKSRAWWGGTIKGAVKGLLVGLAIGAASALFLQFALIPMVSALGLPSIAHAFGSFLTLTPHIAGSFTATGTVLGSAFSMVPLAIFSGVTGMVANIFGSGADAVHALEQQKSNERQRLQEAKILELTGREQALEQQLEQPADRPQSRAVQQILANGPRQATSFAEAEAARINAPSGPTIH